MSKLAPSQSTLYVGNLPYSLTNSDIHGIFEKHGPVAKVTVVKDKETRLSKGVAFVLFKDKESAAKAVAALNGTQLMDRTIKCSIAVDNGRASEFIRKRTYADKSRCYECGESGHLSYKCPKNILGDREQPKKKEKKRRKFDGPPSHRAPADDDDDAALDPHEEEALSEAAGPAWGSDRSAAYEALLSSRQLSARGDGGGAGASRPSKRKGYFSDEENSD